jgi:RNA polymerase sigma-70 factor (ECF subfamily)
LVLETDKTDNELAVLARQGNERAFREILGRYRLKLIGICMRMLRNKTEAEEAAQDSFVKVYTHLSDFDPERNFAAWIAGITINECRDRLRKRSRFKKTFVETSDLINQSAAAPEKIDLESKARLDAVEKAIEKLPEKLKEVLVLKAYGDYSYEEIAESLNIKSGTVMSRLFRAREKLTEIMDIGDK